MENLSNYITDILSENPYKIVISNPVHKNVEPRKIVLTKKAGYFQEERIINRQAFHQSIPDEKLHEHVYTLLNNTFKQLNAFNENYEYSLKISKKGKVFFSRSKYEGGNVHFTESLSTEHNRVKNYIFKEGQVIEPLVDMGIFTKEGKVVKSMYDKYRQINRFVEMIDDAVKDIKDTELNIIDFGCGKSYLTFLLYYYFQFIKRKKVKMVGLDLKEDVIEKCNAVAKKYNYDGLSFKVGDIGSYQPDFPVDMVITLHACDTATDYALLNAVKWNARMIFSVPCCQHELNNQISSGKFSIITRYGIVKERISALLTDAIRANLLTCCGYKTQLLEFVEHENTPKNILIRAVKSNIPREKKEEMMAEVVRLKEEFNLNPTLLDLLEKNNLIGAVLVPHE